MAKLIIKLRGETVMQIPLDPNKEYVAGRGSDAQIPLGNERGISRQHLKFYARDGVWICESLSKFMPIQKGKELIEVLELHESTSFSVPPYDFEFEHEVTATSPTGTPQRSNLLPALTTPVIEETSPKVNSEATVAGVSTLVPYMRISYPNTADDEVLKLEGHLWVAGREADCEIWIDSTQVSRKHFELVHTAEGFFITDLGSSNGTKVNGLKIPPHEPTRIESGDEIKIMNITILFEIRDTHFAQKLQALPAPIDPIFEGAPEEPIAPPLPWYPSSSEDATQMHTSPATPDIPPTLWQRLDWRQNKLRAALMIAAPVLVIFALLPGKPAQEIARKPDAKDSTQSVAFENMKPEQKAAIKDAFVLARNLYVQGKYELCLTELAKVHELVPQYDNSKELQSFCERGRELVQRQRDLERKEKERQAIEQQIAGYVETCKAQLNATASLEETRQCLAEAIQLDPEHGAIKEMLQSAEMRAEEQKLLADQRAESARRIAKARAHFKQAQEMREKGQLAKAINLYQEFLNRSYMGVETEKSSARRELASLKQELKSKVEYLFGQCKDLGSSSKFKEAYEACNNALKEDPDFKEARVYRDQMHSTLKREMKSIYEDSVLEESLGNVDSAKEKWKKIIQENLGFDEYTLKARSKLKRYGIDM